MSEDILAMIDGAIADYTSPDAMRWSPEPEQADAQRVVPWWDGIQRLMEQALAEMAPPNPAPEWAVQPRLTDAQQRSVDQWVEAETDRLITGDGSQPVGPRGLLGLTPVQLAMDNAAATFTSGRAIFLDPAIVWPGTSITELRDRLDAAFRPVRDAAAVLVQGVVRSWKPLSELAIMCTCDADRRERLRRMHTAYARRARARRRRRQGH